MEIKKHIRQRYELLDTIRGIVLVSMMVYHAVWNFVYIYGKEWNWYKSEGAELWQQSICWTFICLSGFCFSLGRNHWKKGFVVFGSGMLVSLATMIAMPSNRVIFGVLTCIGSCILFTAMLEKFLKKIPSVLGVGISFFLFLFMKNINDGIMGIGSWEVFRLPSEWYRNYLTTYFGFPFRGFFSTDYFSFFPWVFLFLSGFYLYEVFERYGWLQSGIFHKKVSVFSFLGKYSLGIYLLHQPLIFGLQEIFFK